MEGIRPNYLLGRLSKDKSNRGNQLIVPYYSRKEIDSDMTLSQKELALCYVDPIDSFFLQIQGSGSVRMPDGEIISLGYDGQNGRKYVAIGKHLLDSIPLDEMSMQRIESHLKSLDKKEMQKILNMNSSYVFFKRLNGRPITSNGTKVVDGRTIATDAKFLPKGALGYLIFNKPKLAKPEDDIPTESQKTSRFVIDQDTGGAISGGGRVDLFWGVGKEAKKYAGVLRDIANLYYLAPKAEFLDRIR